MTAVRLGQKLARISAALQVPLLEADWLPMLSPILWAATHPFSVRMILARLFMRAADGALTYSIEKRLHKAPPGTTGYLQLESFVLALEEAHFFTFVRRTEELNDFKLAISRIRANLHYRAPYSNYLYGKTVADVPEAKEVATKMAHLAASLGDTFLGSTLSLSQSLKRLADAAAVNSVTAHLEVRSYVRAYKTVLEAEFTAGLGGFVRAMTHHSAPALLAPRGQP